MVDEYAEDGGPGIHLPRFAPSASAILRAFGALRGEAEVSERKLAIEVPDEPRHLAIADMKTNPSAQRGERHMGHIVGPSGSGISSVTSKPWRR